MPRLYTYISAFFLLTCFAAKAQGGVFIPSNGQIFFVGESATIFSNLINHGRVGIGRKAIVNFKGRLWENNPQSLLTDETLGGTGVNGQGGIVRFNGDLYRQKINGGYNAAVKTGPVFSNLQVANPFGVELESSNTKVYQEIGFEKGRVYLNNFMFIVGHRNPGKISGFDSSRYFVTGTQYGGGLLIRENIKASDKLVVFPIGTRDFAYTPAAIQTKTDRGDDFFASVFDSTRIGLVAGLPISGNGVQKTWQVGKRYFPDEDEVELLLQHLNEDEGSFFSQNKNHSYISRYAANGWDQTIMQHHPVTGYLTSGSPLMASGLNSRTFSSKISDSYFTKLIGKDSLLKTILNLSAQRTSSTQALVSWRTNQEVNVKEFVVERRQAHEAVFTEVDTVLSQARNGFTQSALAYSLKDTNGYRGISFYRLKIIQLDQSTYYSNIVAINGERLQLTVWPNPTPDQFYVLLDGSVATQIIIRDNLGRTVWREAVNGRNIMDVSGHNLRPGLYYVSILNATEKILDTKKLVVIK